MDAEAPRGITRFFDDVQDPRMDRTKDHKLENILMIALVAVLGGAEAWTQIEMFGKSKRAVVRAVPGTAQRHPESRHVRPGVWDARPR